MAACVTALEAELTRSLEDTGRLEEKNGELEDQLSALREKVGVQQPWRWRWRWRWRWWWRWRSTPSSTHTHTHRIEVIVCASHTVR